MKKQSISHKDGGVTYWTSDGKEHYGSPEAIEDMKIWAGVYAGDKDKRAKEIYWQFLEDDDREKYDRDWAEMKKMKEDE